jgi:prepilin-type processing-associated H-X9-DG protein
MIVFKCGCGQQVQVRDEEVGKLIECTACRRYLIVPETGIRTEQPSEEPHQSVSESRVDPAEALSKAPGIAMVAWAKADANSQSDNPNPTASQAGASGVAKVSLVLGIASLFFSLLTGIPAILLAGITLTNMSDALRPQSRRFAMAGLVAACLGITVNFAAWFLFTDLMSDKASRLISKNNLKQIGLAFHNHHGAAGSLPGNIFDKDGKPLLSWRVAILPYIEQWQLYNEFKLDEPWDSDHNKMLIERMPKQYVPVKGKAKPGETYYQMFEGAWPQLTNKDGSVSLETIAKLNGAANTGLVFEAGEPVIWTKPADMLFDKNQPLPKLGGIFNGECNVLMCDGSARTLQKVPEEEALKLMIMWNNTAPFDLNKVLRPEK